MDISWIKHKSIGGSKFWILEVDEVSRMSWSFFGKTKDDISDHILPLLQKLIELGINIKFIRCDNSPENKSLDVVSTQNKLNINFEYTPRDTPKHNGVVERCFQTLYQRMRAMMNGAGIYDELRKTIWAECSITATLLHNIIIKNNNNKSPYELFYNQKCKILNELRVFGEMGIVKTNYDKITSKLRDKGTTMVFIGYSLDHGTNVYRMLNLNTMGITISRDIIWLNVTYGNWIERKDYSVPDLPVYEFLHARTIPLTPHVNEIISINNDEINVVLNEQDNPVTPSRELTQLMTDDHPILSGQTRSTSHTLLSGMTYYTSSSNVDPIHFNNAWNHPNISERRAWRESIRDELTSMQDKKCMDDT